MNEPAEADGEQQVFFSSKPRLVHMAINIAVAPILLYLLGAWAWPPVLPHYIVFTITFLMALHFARQRWRLPRLVLADGRVKNKVISLGWASREDYQTIQQLLTTRFQRELPQ